VAVKNVVILTDYAFINGGAGKVAIDSARELARSGLHVTLLCAVGPVAESLRDVPNLRIVCLDQPDVLVDHGASEARVPEPLVEAACFATAMRCNVRPLANARIPSG